MVLFNELQPLIFRPFESTLCIFLQTVFINFACSGHDNTHKIPLLLSLVEAFSEHKSE